MTVERTKIAFTNATISSVTALTIVHVNLNVQRAVQIANRLFVFVETIIILVRIGSSFSKLNHKSRLSDPNQVIL